jgi:hypothetical protein
MSLVFYVFGIGLMFFGVMLFSWIGPGAKPNLAGIITIAAGLFVCVSGYFADLIEDIREGVIDRDETAP